MQKVVKVVRHETSDKGRVDLFYTNLDGTTGRPGQPDKAGNLLTKLDEATLGVLKTVNAGDTVTIEITKEGNFWPLTKVTAGAVATAAPKKSWSGGSKSFVQKDDVGAQVGNALNVAAITLGAGSTEAQIEKRAQAVLAIGERLKKHLSSLKTGTPTVTDNAVTPEEVGSFDDDDTFFGS